MYMKTPIKLPSPRTADIIKSGIWMLESEEHMSVTLTLRRVSLGDISPGFGGDY